MLGIIFFILNLSINILSIFFLLNYFKGVSGGDIAVNAFHIIISSIQIVICVMLYFLNKIISRYSLLGLILGFIISFIIFKKIV